MQNKNFAVTEQEDTICRNLLERHIARKGYDQAPLQWYEANVRVPKRDERRARLVWG